MKKTVFMLIAALAILFGATSCGCVREPSASSTPAQATSAPESTVTPPESSPTMPNESTPPESSTPPTEGNTYQISWITKEGEVLTVAKLGEVPTPPEISEVVYTKSKMYTFTGWSKAPEALDTMPEALVRYTAEYIEAVRKYTVSFVFDGKTVATQEVEYNKKATAPEGITVEEGYTNIMWRGISQPVMSNVTMTGYYTVLDGTQLDWCLDRPLLSFMTETPGKSDIYSDSVKMASVLLYVALEANASPADNPNLSLWVERAVADLHNMVTAEDAAPFFDLEPYWCYVPLTAAIALCRETPAIWNELSALDREKLTFTMKCFAYIGALGTSDQNDYKTGPGLQGNYGKLWNPNYRLANTLPMLFVARFFGGADQVDAVLADFDFDDTLAKFDTYGFTRAKARWSTPAPQFADGSYAPSPKKFMEEGGPAYLGVRNDETGDRLEIKAGDPAGSGAGVRVAYRYGGYRLDQVSEILALLLEYNYSGGEVFSSTEDMAGGLAPSGKPYCYILDGTVSPMEGEVGMMREFNCGDGNGIRSSCNYTRYDFIMIVSTLAAAEAMDMYDITSSANANVFRLALVGNADFIYKYEHGYMSYSLGHSEETIEGEDDGYLLWKAWWQSAFGDIGRENLPELVQPGVPSEPQEFFKTDYDSAEFSFVSGPKETTGYAVHQELEYVVRNKEKLTYTAIGGRLIISQGAGGSDGGINYETQNGLYGQMQGGDLLTISLTLSAGDAEQMLESVFRLRGKCGSANTFMVLFSTTADGKLLLGGDNGKVITTLANEAQTVTIKVDFRNGKLSGECGGKTQEMVLAIPESSTAESTAAWLSETVTSRFVFQWYIMANGSDKARAITLNSMAMSASAAESGEGEARAIIDIDYTGDSFVYEGGPKESTGYAVTNGIEYTIKGKLGVSYSALSMGENTVLSILQEAGSADGAMKAEMTQGLYGRLGGSTSLVLRVDLAMGEAASACALDMRLRGKSTLGNNFLTLFTTTAEGDVLALGEADAVITRLGEELQTLTFLVDFEAAEMKVLLGESEAMTLALSIPENSLAEELAAWLADTKTSGFIFECYIAENAGEADASILLDNLYMGCPN